MADQISPLQVIKQKELALQRRVEAAQGRAETRLQAAREAAARTIAQAEQQGQSEAETRYRQGLETAWHEAGAILSAAQAQADDLRCRARARLEDAARQMIELILPVTAGDPQAAIDVYQSPAAKNVASWPGQT